METRFSTIQFTTMKTNAKSKPSRGKLHFRLPRLRLAAAGALFLAAAALATTAMHPPKIPWAVPTAHAGHNPLGTAVDPGTNTIYVANTLSNTVSVIDGSKCNSGNSSGCAPLAAIPIGKFPTQALFDATTDTIYVLLGGGDSKSVAVIDGRHCNAQDTSGCKQARVAKATTASLVCGGSPRCLHTLRPLRWICPLTHSMSAMQKMGLSPSLIPRSAMAVIRRAAQTLPLSRPRMAMGLPSIIRVIACMSRVS